MNQPTRATPGLVMARGAALSIMRLTDRGMRPEDIVEHLVEFLDLRRVTLEDVRQVLREENAIDQGLEPDDVADGPDEPAWNEPYGEDA